MRILICGDRYYSNHEKVENFVKSLSPDTIIIQGDCKGADYMAKKYGNKYGLEVLSFPADWKQYGRGAGPVRNIQMIEVGKPDLVVAFHDNYNNSRGTKNMIKTATESKIPCIFNPKTLSDMEKIVKDTGILKF